MLTSVSSNKISSLVGALAKIQGNKRLPAGKVNPALFTLLQGLKEKKAGVIMTHFMQLSVSPVIAENYHDEIVGRQVKAWVNRVGLESIGLKTLTFPPDTRRVIFPFGCLTFAETKKSSLSALVTVECPPEIWRPWSKVEGFWLLPDATAAENILARALFTYEHCFQTRVSSEGLIKLPPPYGTVYRFGFGPELALEAPLSTESVLAMKAITTRGRS